MLNRQQRNYTAISGFYTPEMLNTILLPTSQLDSRNLGYVRSLQYFTNNYMDNNDVVKTKKVKLSFNPIYILLSRNVISRQISRRNMNISPI